MELDFGDSPHVIEDLRQMIEDRLTAAGGKAWSKCESGGGHTGSFARGDEAEWWTKAYQVELGASNVEAVREFADSQALTTSRMPDLHPIS